MELINFVKAFFISKKISMLTAFICWPPDTITSLWQQKSASGLRWRVYSDFLQLPELPAYAIHREGVLLDVDCPGADAVLQKASASRAFIHRYSWLLLQNSTHNSSTISEFLTDTEILPDSDVVWSSLDGSVDVYRIKNDHPIIFTHINIERGTDLKDMELLWSRLPTAVAKRKHLGDVYLSAATVITQPQHFKGWTDLSNRQIDTFPKLTYPLMMLLAEDLHFRYNLKQVDLYGEEHNGSFDGVSGLLQRRAVELGVTSLFLRADRLRVMHFSSETVELKGAFIFRQPSQSAVSNVFLLPFSRGVWTATGVVLFISALLLALASWRLRTAHPELDQVTLAECFSFAIGTICQQGFYLSPGAVPVRVAMVSALVSSLFLFTAYSAKIVSLLQSPSTAIQTIEQLTQSPLILGVQETTYKRTYFAESKEPATQRLYRRKLLPLGDRAYLSVVDGVARLRTGLFAFQVEESSGYEIISKTFSEFEKCGLQQIQAFKLPMVAVPLVKHSGVRDLVAARLRWQREVGLMGRWRRRWLAAKPRCDAGAGGSISVGLADVLPALQIWMGGAALAVTLLLVEIAARAMEKTKVKRRTPLLLKLLPSGLHF